MALAWSYSRLQQFEQCGKKFQYYTVDKTVKEDTHPAAEEGTKDHEAFEKYLKYGVPNRRVTDHKDFLDKLLTLKHRSSIFEPEYEITFDEDFNFVGWFDKSAYIRLKIDLLIVSKDGKKAFIWDWKTNNKIKRQDNEKQSQFYAVMLAIAIPDLEKITCAFYYTKHDEIVSFTYSEDSFEDMTDSLFDRNDAMQHAVETKQFEANPSWFNCNYCAAKAICKHAYV